MAHAERIDEALQRNLSPPFDRGKEIAYGSRAVTFDVFKFQPGVALLQREDISGLPHPFLVEEILQLLLAEPVDVEGAPRHEQFQVLDLLERTGELARAPRARTLLAGRSLLAHHIGMQRARALLRKMKFFRALGPLVDHDIDHLRNAVAGALDHDRVADPDIAPLPQFLALVADALDVIFVVQRHVLHDDATDADRLELADRRERAGASDLDLDIAQHRHGARGREFVRNAPARGARDEAKAALPVVAIDFVDDAVDVVVELRTLLLDLAMKREQLFDRMTELGQRIGLEAATLKPGNHAGLRVFRYVAHLAPGVGKEAERTRRGDRRVFLAQRSGGGIARIGEYRVAGGLLPLVASES